MVLPSYIAIFFISSQFLFCDNAGYVDTNEEEFIRIYSNPLDTIPPAAQLSLAL